MYMTKQSKTQEILRSNESTLDRFRRWGESIFNNIDQVNYFGRLKDVSKIFEALASGIILTRRYNDTPQGEASRLRVGMIADAINGVFQIGLSYLSNWDDKSRTLRTYEKLVKEEFSLDRAVTFDDLKHSQNPIIRDTASYYSRKALYRLIPDFFNFIRFVPRALGLLGEGAYKATKPLEDIPGITMSLGVKGLYFGWYFTERIEGSHYALKGLWNKTEGVTTSSNRQINQNVEPGTFVRWGEVSKLYTYFCQEHPQMNLSVFTPDDPLTSRVFEQVARYLNHSYQPKLFAMQESKEKQEDLKGKYFSHAMLVDFLGSGSLRVEDAIGSAIRLEIMAHYGQKDNIGESMKKLREADHMLKQIPRPALKDYASVEQGTAALKNYFAQMSNVAEHFLGDAWPTAYFEKEIKPGYMDFYFGGNLPDERKEAMLADMTPPKELPAPTTIAPQWSQDRVAPAAPLSDKFSKATSHAEHALATHNTATPAIGA